MNIERLYQALWSGLIANVCDIKSHHMNDVASRDVAALMAALDGIEALGTSICDELRDRGINDRL